MGINDIRNRVFDDLDFQKLLVKVVVESIATQFDLLVPSVPIGSEPIPWNYLLTAASLFAESENGEQQDAALRIAQYCLSANDVTEEQKGAAFVILDDMANAPAIGLAKNRTLLPENIEIRSSFSIRARLMRNRLESTVELADSTSLRLTKFQQAFWEGLTNAQWVSVSAPTSAGKSFVITRWLLDHISEEGGVIAYLVPTRALIGQVENDLKSYAKETNLDVRISTIPRGESIEKGKPTVLVFTQERMHLLLTQGGTRPAITHLVVDEAQKIGDRHRGVLLQQVSELLVEAVPSIRVTFVSPMTDNPSILFRDAPANAIKQPVISEGVTVNQNLLWVTQKSRRPKEWKMQVSFQGELYPVGDFSLSYKPEPESKRLPFVASALASTQGGSIIYVNRASDAEKVAMQLYELLGEEREVEEKSEVKELSDLVKDVIHPDYLLATVLTRGIAFHYGNMPLLVRSEVERLFSEGKIGFLVCTSTLVEGVNTSCKTISVRGPKKGNNNLMSADDFWNLAGRAGRLGKEFQGNIVCVDADKARLWAGGAPPRKRTRYVIERTTDEILSDPLELIAYCEAKALRSEAQRRPDLEYVSTYLMLLHRKYGSLDDAAWAASMTKESLANLNQAMQEAWDGVEIPLEVAQRSPGINPMAMQRLLLYLCHRTDVDCKPIEELLPAQPGSDDAGENYAAIISRCASYLNGGLGPPGRRSFALAILITRWMRGFPLARLISDRISYEERRSDTVDIPGLIRSVLDDVERIARFEAPRTITAYLDVLRLFLSESGNEKLAEEVEDIGLFLEMGMSIPTQIALLGLGLSRSTAIRLSELLANDAMNEAEVRAWLTKRTWEATSLPALVKREIERYLTELGPG